MNRILVNGKKQATIYFTPETNKWLSLEAIKKEKTRSEIVEDAIIVYRHVKPNERKTD